MEFIVHALQLEQREALFPQLGKAIESLIVAGHLSPKFAKADALLSRLLVMIRLIAPDCSTPPEAAQDAHRQKPGSQRLAKPDGLG